LLAGIAGCAGRTISAVALPVSSPIPPAPQYVKHVVIVVQENRSFDNLFSGFPGADAPTFGYAGRRKLVLHETRLENRGNIENNWRDSIGSYNHGEMDGFEVEHFYGGPLDYAYAYVPRSQSAPYWKWHANTFWPIACFQLNSAQASPPT
jgi:hypothetical protein